jgi:hypothetical protein
LPLFHFFFSTALFTHFCSRGILPSFNKFFSHLLEQKYNICPDTLIYIVPVPFGSSLLQNEHFIFSPLVLKMNSRFRDVHHFSQTSKETQVSWTPESLAFSAFL